MEDCTLDPEVISSFQTLKLSNAAAHAIVLKINKATMTVEIENDMPAASIDEIAQTLSETNPRFICYSYKWARKDGRVQFPLVLISYCPATNASLSMLYSRGKTSVIKTLGITRVFDIRELDEFTSEWFMSSLESMR